MRLGEPREMLRDGLHLAVLANFAVAQPLLAVLAGGPAFFVARSSEPIDVVLVVLFVCAGLPLIGLAIEAAAGLLGRLVRRAVHTMLVALLAACIVIPPLARTDWLPGSMVLLDGLVFGAGTALAYLRFRAVGMVLTALAPAPLLFAGLFLFSASVRKLVWPGAGSVVALSQPAVTTPVVMVVFDELGTASLLDERGRIDPARYPNFAALAEDATWYRNATTVSDATAGAVPAILTGKYPRGLPGEIPTAAGHPQNLFTLLGGSHELVVFESITRLCEPLACRHAAGGQPFVERMRSLTADLSVVYLRILVPPDLAAGLPVVTGAWKDFATVRRKDADGFPKVEPPKRAAFFVRYLSAIRPSPRPGLFFLHVLLPHLPWRYLPSGKVYQDDPVSEPWDDDEWAVLLGLQRHFLQVGFVDKLLGDLVARLEAEGLYEQSLIVITADHGISFKTGGPIRPVSSGNDQDIMPVPLFVKLPGQRRGAVSDRNVETIDILPTIADVLGIRLPWEVDGQSVLDPHAPERPWKVIFSYNTGEKIVVDPARAVRTGSLKPKRALFGPGERADWVYRIGPYAALVGRGVDERSVSGVAGVEVDLAWQDLYADLSLDGVFVPARVHGWMLTQGQEREPLYLAIAVNGTVRAVTRTSRWQERRARFSAMVPEEAFREGANAVEIFVVSGPPGWPRLARTMTASSRGYVVSVEPGSEREVLVPPAGAAIPIVPGALVGHLDSATISEKGLILGGWAADGARRRLPKAILIFVDGRFRYAATTTVGRDDVAAMLGSTALRKSGFSIDLPPHVLADATLEHVRVFALSETGVASELGYFWEAPDPQEPGSR